ncbi:hypothetical protein [uncultured Delftia sp.]|uniref:hypothetical protein n=1 Tax=uncultured Delftia sp. TaxID=191464 RepID=UPI00259AD5D2|nr:hypothetical protein [uncultured Delftia sp.]
MSRYLLQAAFYCFAVLFSLSSYAQENEYDSVKSCISKLATAGAIIYRASGPSTHPAITWKSIDVAFGYFQGAESLARLLPPNAGNAFVADDEVMYTKAEKFLETGRRLDNCEKWARQVYGSFSSQTRENVNNATKVWVSKIISATP